MEIIIGLGNTGEQYKNTRHNIGFMAIDSIAQSNDFSDWEEKKQLQAEICQGKIADNEVLLAKPLTMMNNSGTAVKLLVTGYCLLVTNIWIIHDEIDLPLGKIKIVRNRGSAGHKGVESIIKHLESNDFVRFRLGIQPRDPYKQPRTRRQVTDFVLSPFTPQEKNLKKQTLKKAQKAIILAIKEGIEKAMGRYNK